MGNVVKPLLSLGSVVAAPFTAGTSLAWLPAALGGANALAGALGQSHSQNAYGNQQQAGIDSLLNWQGLAQPELSALNTGMLNTGQSQINTFMKNFGPGMANPGAVAQDMFSQNRESAMQGMLGLGAQAAGQKFGALQSGLGANASLFDQQDAMPNPWSSALPTFQNALQSIFSHAAPQQNGSVMGSGASGSLSIPTASNPILNPGGGVTWGQNPPGFSTSILSGVPSPLG